MTKLAVMLDAQSRRRLLSWAQDERAVKVEVLVRYARRDADREGRPAYCDLGHDRQKVIFDTEVAALDCCAELQAIGDLPECRAYRHEGHWHLTSWVEQP